MNKRFILSLLFLISTLHSVAADAARWTTWRTKYYPIGTKWTELRLDTTKYDSWYSKVGGEWIPNYERIDYFVDEDTIIPGFYSLEAPATKVYRLREGKADPLSYVLIECEDVDVSYDMDEDRVYISLRRNVMPWPVCLYSFRCWSVGYVLTSLRLKNSLVGMARSTLLGTIQEMGESYFGGEHKLTYAKTDKGHLVIDGIGVTAWAGPDCIFGPTEVGEALHYCEEELIINYPELSCYPGESPFCTILAHFERNEEVLYDMWPQPGNENSIKGLIQPYSTSLDREKKQGLYDLQGRKLQKAPEKGLYIQAGKKKTHSRP